MSHTLPTVMKTTLSLCLALLAASSVQAQIFRSEAVKGAVLGGIAGAVIGHNSGDLRHNGWHGAAIGATAGLLIGQAVGDANAHRDYRRYDGASHGGYVYRSAPRVHVGIGYSGGHGYYGSHRGSWGHGHRGYFGHGGYHRGFHGRRGISWNLSYAPSFGYYSGGYGWSYPDLAYDDYIYRAASAPVIVQQPQPTVVQAPVQQQTQAVPQQVTIINNYYNSSTPMSAANGLFGR